MTKQLLIYEKVVPVSQERHLDWHIQGKDYAFSRSVNSVPLMATEFPFAANDYTIVFAGNQATGEILPAILLGMGEKNLYLSETGEWKAKYVPAFVRRYPFVFARHDDGSTLTLCIDEEFEGCNQDGLGERLFAADGEQTPYLQEVLKFLQEYQAHFQRTLLFCKRLKEFDLLEPMHAVITLGDDKKLSLDGFMAVNRDKLKALSGEQLAELAMIDELELIYLHLHSIRNFSKMGILVSEAASEFNAEQTPLPVA